MRFLARFRSIQCGVLLAGAAALCAPLPALAANDSAGPQALWASSLPDLAGHAQALSQYKGRALVVNFWASWCGPCVEEMPALSALQAQYSTKGIQFVGIGIDSADNINSFLKKVSVNYPIYVAGFGGANLARSFGDAAGGLPFTVVLDRSGRVRYAKLGRVDVAALQRALGTL